MSLDREYFQVVHAESGYPLQKLDSLPNKEEAKAAGREAAMSHGDLLSVVKVTVKEVATFQRSVSVTATDLP